MKRLSETKTETNILKTYQAEARNREIYRACGDQAESEGMHKVANLFRAVCASEKIHSRSLLMALREISGATCDLWKAGGFDPSMVKNSSAENLKNAIANVSSEFSELYPGLIRDAENDGWDFAKQCFTYARAANDVHKKLFEKVSHNPDQPGSVDYYVCESCGNTMDHKPAGSCTVCGSSQSAFVVIN